MTRPILLAAVLAVMGTMATAKNLRFSQTMAERTAVEIDFSHKGQNGQGMTSEAHELTESYAKKVIRLPKFDPALGRLDAVEISFMEIGEARVNVNMFCQQRKRKNGRRCSKAHTSGEFSVETMIRFFHNGRARDDHRLAVDRVAWRWNDESPDRIQYTLNKTSPSLRDDKTLLYTAERNNLDRFVGAGNVDLRIFHNVFGETNMECWTGRMLRFEKKCLTKVVVRKDDNIRTTIVYRYTP